MEMERISSVYERLMARGLSAGSLAGDDAHGIGDGGVAGKSAPRHQPTKREGGPLPMGMEPGKGRGPKPAPVQQGGGQHRGDLKPLCKIQNNLNVGEPSSANGRPVLRLLQGGSSKRSATTNVTLRLVLT
jgi:hypothetical protein